jgi:ADP-ribose pyrophosphatase YjhB (NUDIX family)
VPSWFRDPDAPAPNRPRKVGVCFVVELGDRVLVDTRLDGELAFLGGTLEPEESVPACLARELREETGLGVVEARLLGVFSDPTRLIGYLDGSVHPVLTIAFVVEPDGDDPRPSDESRGFQLVPRGELADLPLTAVHRQIRDAYVAGRWPVVP